MTTLQCYHKEHPEGRVTIATYTHEGVPMSSSFTGTVSPPEVEQRLSYMRQSWARNPANPRRLTQ